MTETLVTVENLSKKFCRDLRKSMRYGLRDLASDLLGRRAKEGVLRRDEFWAIRDVTFELMRGQCLGIIGPNGAGKSTLLKMLTGLVRPDRGRISVRGRVGALIELGAGFNPVLTGRENVYINGAILGMSKREIDQRFDAIVGFAELAEFIDSPLQNYSSGMKVRLGFAIAAHTDPDVLIIDEVLAVGDVGFRAKCFNLIYQKMPHVGIIFVSHAMPQVSRICTDLLVLRQGRAAFQGPDVAGGIEEYYASFKRQEPAVVHDEVGDVSISHVGLSSGPQADVDSLAFGEPLTLSLTFRVAKHWGSPSVSITIATQELQEITQCSSFFDGATIPNDGGEIRLEVELGRMYLNPAPYTICLTITGGQHGRVLYKCQNIRSFRVTGAYVGHTPVQIKGRWKLTDRRAVSE